MNESLQSDLASADPVPGAVDQNVRDLAQQLTIDTRDAAAAGSAARVPR